MTDRDTTTECGPFTRTDTLEETDSPARAAEWWHSGVSVETPTGTYLTIPVRRKQEGAVALEGVIMVAALVGIFAVCVTVLVNLYTDLATATNDRLNDLESRVVVLEETKP